MPLERWSSEMISEVSKYYFWIKTDKNYINHLWVKEIYFFKCNMNVEG